MGTGMVTIDLFRNADKFETFAAGQVIFKEGEVGQIMYVVLEGTVQLKVNGQLVETLGPGGALGEMALLDSTPRSATATAETDCKLVPIDERRFSFLIQQTPRFAIQIMRIMAWGRLKYFSLWAKLKNTLFRRLLTYPFAATSTAGTSSRPPPSKTLLKISIPSPGYFGG